MNFLIAPLYDSRHDSLHVTIDGLLLGRQYWSRDFVRDTRGEAGRRRTSRSAGILTGIGVFPAAGLGLKATFLVATGDSVVATRLFVVIARKTAYKRTQGTGTVQTETRLRNKMLRIQLH